MKPRLLISTRAASQREEHTETLQTAESKWLSIIYVAKVERAAMKSSSVVQHYKIDKQANDNLIASVSRHLFGYEQCFPVVDCTSQPLTGCTSSFY